jgi:hypothetical protein
LSLWDLALERYLFLNQGLLKMSIWNFLPEWSLGHTLRNRKISTGSRVSQIFHLFLKQKFCTWNSVKFFNKTTKSFVVCRNYFFCCFSIYFLYRFSKFHRMLFLKHFSIFDRLLFPENATKKILQLDVWIHNRLFNKCKNPPFLKFACEMSERAQSSVGFQATPGKRFEFSLKILKRWKCKGL